MEQGTSDIRDSVILTLYNRDSITVSGMIRGLLKNDLLNTEIIIVNDGSNEEHSAGYEELVGGLRHQGADVQYHVMPAYEAYRVSGRNSPARAFNEGVRRARGERLFLLASDVILQPQAFTRARRFKPDEAVYVCQVVDIDTGALLNGPAHTFPMPWFVSCSTEKYRSIGGYDEEYLKGVAFEDNDFMGRLAIATGRIVFDWDVLAFHQSHEQIPYSNGLSGFKLSGDYTKQKWGGVPFGNDPCVQVRKGLNDKGLVEWECSYYNDEQRKRIEQSNADLRGVLNG